MGEMKNILDDFMNINANGKPYMHLMQKMKGCGHKMKTWYFGDDVDDTEGGEIAIDDPVPVMDETVDYQYGLPVLMVGMSIFFSFMMLCVVVCSGWKYVFAKKKLE